MAQQWSATMTRTLNSAADPADPAGQPTPNADEMIEASDDGYETASARSVPSFDGTMSLSASVRDYAFENDRRYHRYREGRYHFPNDDPEQQREYIKHIIMTSLLGGELFQAPLKTPQKVLDVGTGTGYPGAAVVGNDLSPIWPDWVPPNTKFVVDDAEAEWYYERDSYDLIRLGNMAPSIHDWPKLLESAYKTLKPGGWIELQEMRWVYGCDDGTIPNDYAPVTMVENIKEGLARFGIDMNAAEQNPGRVEAAGFVNVLHQVKKVPVGRWPRNKFLRTIGLYTLSVIYDGLHAITIGPFTRGLGWTADQVERFLVQVRKDLMDPSVHSYVYFHALSGQKPL
ncbi:methyltransferase domain-containing protein [Colletotrichum truncatum]|uniref:Methyltransferase domain-containing protein n=1 Tax=Colletotrichum truncatum TaxID=5467 RepID=A0ACC3YRK3_COLTU|nr:methyltransferase domain-containing protein [Colletotrichum truncatum]KAF6799288.1 methyltransferase domain-containing protein [Colletotrichum truncatum]